MMQWIGLRVAVVLATIYLTAAVPFKLTILHTNDVHARFEQFDGYGGECSTQESDDGECFGGVARRVSKIRQIRAAEENVLLLDGGDQFQGTMWFYLYKGQATSHFMNITGYDAMAIGNHEFDNAPEGLSQFLTDVPFPVLSSNIDASLEPSIDGLFHKSTVLTVGGQKIGIVGYTYARTPEISTTGKLEFSDEVTAVQAEVDRLQTEYGIDKMIALGHAGFDIDLKIARKVRGVDIVIGGHTNTFLYTGSAPSAEVPEGDYPTVVHPDYDATANVLVVQDYTFGKYLGRLDVTFDDNGNVTEWGGNPILLDENVPQAADVLQEIEKWAETVRNFSNVYIGRTHVLLDGSCRLAECNLGNFLADAYVRQAIRFPDELQWNDVSIAIVNGGSIRATLYQGDITIGDVLTVSPFGSTVDTVTIKGVYLMEALENSVAEYDPVSRPGRFLQFSGMIVTYDLSQTKGSRVVNAEVRCTECEVPQFVPLDLEKVYKVVMPSYIVGGGDGYSMIRDNVIEHDYGNLDSSVASEYIQWITPATPGLERRILFVDPSDPSDPPNPSDPSPSDPSPSDPDPCGTGSANRIHRLTPLWLLLIAVLMQDFVF
ncbi:snake venom 5'-nucleotidase-like [Patiria miniata]|uniref:5'-nucleotidase n=1 Tax=Patiria miniata TaxID=46514 RepID=A0A914A8I9_PATMI|nr:snake venom 5'-nucleotidase-like [Patiria miniata]